MTSLEEILKEYFHCEKPFDLDGNLTEHGVYHTERLINLLHDLESIGVISDAWYAESQIDEIVGQDCVGKDKKWNYIRDIRRFVSYGNDYTLKEPFNALYKDGTEFIIKKIGFDIDTKDLFCIIKDEPDDVDCVMMSDLCFDSIVKLHEYVLSTEIDDGWDWKEHAHKMIRRYFPDVDSETVEQWITDYWDNLETDADNIEALKELE